MDYGYSQECSDWKDILMVVMFFLSYAGHSCSVAQKPIETSSCMIYMYPLCVWALCSINVVQQLQWWNWKSTILTTE